ncbi:MAG: N-formylglutamate amidohydrolase [Nitrosopumilaceae archaeon]|nr:N-formylglutamate amidohydrolase [Nitrosopumilaceae archaeon]NIU00432.1 N-formylglutamate amidohydrolase [Nitrosopumilaceae archaeon]NIU87109.1 N-formylglutamate amidohydrolase [Nitrosopumilaceae archaeon]NIV65664.1 N-formylglutamate amidohydrolase [Nitrosopumilaceae archaeon]NIX61034.1 N-formylglutamate amidohydrolase [Nitrosopumilaceae archaeon]
MTFPVLICIPHGGTKVPIELKERVIISDKDLFDDNDSFTKEIYDLSSGVTQIIYSDYARAFIDMNRNIDDLPPKVPDGIIKSTTCYQRPIYKEGKEPDIQLTKNLIEKYYKPYHNKIKDAISKRSLKIALDCHSMAATGPSISPDVGRKRPVICLGNCFGKSCPRDMTEKLARCFEKGFKLSPEEILLNDPFTGKYTTKKYGNKPIPWVHVELNRKLFLDEPWFDRNSLSIDRTRLFELNSMFAETLRLYFES